VRTGFIDWSTTADGKEKLALYVFEKQGNRSEYTGTAEVPADGGLTASSLAALVKDGMQQIYLSVPFSLLTLREMTFPFSDKAKIRDTISFELEGLLLGSVNDYSIDHIITEYIDSGCRALAVCIEKTKLGEIIDVFSSAGLEPRVITSIDLRLSGGRSESLLEGLNPDAGARAGAAGEEIMSPLLNLRQNELAYTGDIERSKRALRLTASLLLALMLMLGAHVTLKFIAGKKESSRLNQELTSVYQSVFPEDKKIIDPVRQFKGNINLLKEKKAVLGGIPVLDALNNIANLKNRSITLNEFSADGKNLIIKGTAAAFEEVDSFRNSLSPAYDGVKILNSDATADRKINFTIIMQEKTS